MDRDLAGALAEDHWNGAIRAAMAEGLALTGPDVGKVAGTAGFL